MRGLHDHDPMFREISLSEDVKRICGSLGFRDPRILQSMIICKQPEIGGKGTFPCFWILGLWKSLHIRIQCFCIPIRLLP